jgi:hypothetical protein
MCWNTSGVGGFSRTNERNRRRTEFEFTRRCADGGKGGRYVQKIMSFASGYFLQTDMRTAGIMTKKTRKKIGVREFSEKVAYPRFNYTHQRREVCFRLLGFVTSRFLVCRHLVQ